MTFLQFPPHQIEIVEYRHHYPQSKVPKSYNLNTHYHCQFPFALVASVETFPYFHPIDVSSVIIALARKPKQQNGNNNIDDKKIDVIATVELRLQPTDAKIPFSQPWFDKLERRLGQLFSKNNQQQQPIALKPYLSNLCVDEKVRGRQIGKALCRVVECIARDSWNYNHIYLHVDLENVAALNLYRSEGYNDVGIRWNPFWAGKASEIGYYVKKL